MPQEELIEQLKSVVALNILSSMAAIAIRTILPRAVRAIVLFSMLTTAAFTQIRLYDPANDDLSKKTRDAFATFSKGDNSVFETMISNTLSLKSATLSELYELNQQSVQDKVNLIPAGTWLDLMKQLKKTQNEFLDAYNTTQTILDPTIQAAPDIKTALQTVQDKLQKRRNQKESAQTHLDAAAPQLETLKKSLQDLRSAVAASTKPVKQLSDLAEFKNLKDAWESVTSVKDWFAAAQKAVDSPGLQLTILDLGLQHRQLEVQRLQLQLDQANAAMQIQQRIKDRLAIIWGDGAVDSSGHVTHGLFGYVYRYITTTKQCENRELAEDCLIYPFVTDQNEQVLQTIGKLANAAKGEVGTGLNATMKLRDLLDILSRYVALTGYHKYLLLADAVESGTDAQLFAIRLSALNTQDREMLVSHGLDGLAAYYAGGIKPEQIANFFRAAEAAATAVLAGRVK